MPSADNEIHSAVVRSNKRIDPSLLGQYTGVETVLYKKEEDGGYTYVLRSETPRTYDTIEASINALDKHLIEADKENSQQCESNFIRIIDDSKTSSGKIMLSGNLAGIMSTKTGKFLKGVEIWRQAATVPPRKRVMADEEATTTTAMMMIDPVLKRLNKQLHVDFAIEVRRGADEKRKRQPTRSIYEEAALEAEHRVKRPYVKKSTAVKTKSSSSKDSISSAEISEIDEEEFCCHDEVKKKKKAEEAGFVSMSIHQQLIDAKDHVIKTQNDLIANLQSKIVVIVDPTAVV